MNNTRLKYTLFLPVYKPTKCYGLDFASCLYSKTDKGPSEIGTTSLKGTKLLAPKYPLFRRLHCVQAVKWISGQADTWK